MSARLRGLKQQRFVVMLPLPLKERLRERARDLGVPMRSVLIACLEGELGSDWRDEVSDERLLPGTQRLWGEGS